MNDGTQRRLAAIVSADVVGYSRLMGVDEVGTFRRLNEHRSEHIDPLIAKHGGRIVKTTGDGLLLEFPSVVAAVECCVAVQEGMAVRVAEAQDEAIRFRIGVHLGDVIVEGDDIFGDGVNIAARLQEIGHAGGVTISGNAHDSVDGRIEAGFVDGGEQELKNIAKSVRVWRWSIDTGPKPAVADAPLQLPDKPSIAVLPFDNLSGDPEQEYIADGIAEDIITALSKFRWFFVTARNSTFTYKGSAIDIKQVGRKLNVRYVIEGSVRKAGSRIRISAQLIETESGNHIWAERYDRSLDDIFELQDEITRTIAAAVEPELAGTERERAWRKPTKDLHAWELFQRGVAKMWLMDRESVNEGSEFMEQAIEMDPSFGQPYGYLAFRAFGMLVFGWTEDRKATLSQGIADAKKAISIDQRDYFAHLALGRLHLLAGDHAAAVRELEMSISINPNFAHGYYGLAAANIFGGNAETAGEQLELAMQLSPSDPMMWIFLTNRALTNFMTGELKKAAATAEHACSFPTAQFSIFVFLGAIYAIDGRKEDAAKAVETACRMEANLSIAYVRKFVAPLAPGILDEIIEGLQLAGMPEE